MSKEYTYDIDKYTIGVDENGEGGIGMTVAKIENGEINVLGNCYGENARCIDLLIKENQELKEKIEAYEDPKDLTLMFMYCDEKAKDKIRELKKQLEEHKIQYFKDAGIYSDKILELENQQKEFIKYIEEEINKWHYNYDSYNFEYEMAEPPAEELLENALSKYKETIGNDINVGSKGEKDER